MDRDTAGEIKGDPVDIAGDAAGVPSRIMAHEARFDAGLSHPHPPHHPPPAF